MRKKMLLLSVSLSLLVVISTLDGGSASPTCQEQARTYRQDIVRHLTGLTEDLRKKAKNSQEIRNAIGYIIGPEYLVIKSKLRAQPDYQNLHNFLTKEDTIYKQLYETVPINQVADLAGDGTSAATLKQFVESPSVQNRLKKISSLHAKIHGLFQRGVANEAFAKFRKLYAKVDVLPEFTALVNAYAKLDVNMMDFFQFLVDDVITTYTIASNKCLK